MESVAGWQLAHDLPYDFVAWQCAPFWLGLLASAEVLPRGEYYREVVLHRAESARWQPGPRRLHADDHAVTQSYFALYERSRDPRTVQPSLACFDEMARHPQAESLEFHKDKREHSWVWCDALFMSAPALAMAGHATGNASYWTTLDRRWWQTAAYLQDPRERLFYRDSRFFTKREANGSPVFWSRGNGWVLAGLARVLAHLAHDFPSRARYLELFRGLAERLASIQQPNGTWASGLLDPAAYPEPESSGTALITYGLAAGVNHGYLERERFLGAVTSGWSALVQATGDDGKLGYVQPRGARPEHAGAEHTEIFGAGALLLAGAEVFRLSAT